MPWPALVRVRQEDKIIDFAEGRHLASIVPGARFLALPTGTHYFPVNDGVTNELVEAIDRFTQPAAKMNARPEGDADA